MTDPDGTRTTLVEGPDPRFGMQSSLATAFTMVSPGGVSSTLSMSRQVSLSDPTNLLSLTALNDTIVLDGQTYTRGYDAASRQIITRTPARREKRTILDSKGRILSFLPDSSLAPLTFTYDGRGRTVETTHGGQITTYTYDSLGRVGSRQN